MRRYKTTMLPAVISMLAMVFIASATWALALDWNKRPGTIFHAKSLTDGSTITLDLVVVEKIAHKDAKYFTVHEPFSPKDKIVVYSSPSPLLRRGMAVDISGIVSTLPNGQRAVINVTVWGYCDNDGRLMMHPPLIKNPDSPKPWPNKMNLTIEASPAPVTSTSPEPNETPPLGPRHYVTIHDLLNRVGTMALGDFISFPVEFLCKPVASVSGENNYFEIGEDGGSQDTLKVYYSAAASTSTSQRVCRVVGQLREGENSEEVLCVDSGPGYNAQDGEGSLTLASDGTIGFAKTLPDGASITLGTEATGKIVTRSFPGSSISKRTTAPRASGLREPTTDAPRATGYT